MDGQKPHVATKIVLVFLCLLVKNSSSAPKCNPVVSTNVGVIRGIQATDGDYTMYTGIPFATVDENNPFGAAIPHPGFNEVFDATRDVNLCPQMNEQTWESIGTLDCLQLNVYVPNSASPSNRLPVMVWIYGGGYAIGDAGLNMYGPRNLVRHDVILVTVNYRVGPYGFMCLHTPEVPGNQGIKDQLLGLKWIQNNIEAFGGDINSVTLFGQSAGGVSVDLQLYFNQETLFDKVIFQSGHALGPWGVHEPDLIAPIKLATQLGYKTDNVEEALSILAKINSKLVNIANTELGLSFRTCVEKEFNDGNAFMTVHPLNTGITKNNYSMLIGVTNDESYGYRFFSDIQLLRELIGQYLVDYFNFDADKMTENEQLIKQFYVGDAEINDSNKQGIVDFDSDLVFNYPVARSIPKYLENGANSIYQFVFSYSGGRNMVPNSGKAVHGDELMYLFTQSFNSVTPTYEDQLMIDRITTLWTNFAKYGNPTPAVTEVLPVTWTPVTKEDTTIYLNIDSQLSIQHEPFSERIKFWQQFYETNKNAQKGYEENAS